MKSSHPQNFDALFTEDFLEALSDLLLMVNDGAETDTSDPLDDNGSTGYVRYSRLKNALFHNKFFKENSINVSINNNRPVFIIGSTRCFIDSSIQNKTYKKAIDLLNLDQPDLFDNQKDKIQLVAFKIIPSIDENTEAYVKLIGYNSSAQVITEWSSLTKTSIIKTLDADLPPSYEIPSVDFDEIDQEQQSDENLDGKNDLLDSNE